MKFYLGTNAEGRRTLYPWEKDIPKGMNAPEIDIPTDKNGLMAAIQELLTEADELKAQVSQTEDVLSATTRLSAEDLKRLSELEDSETGSSDKDRPLISSMGIDPYRPSWTLEQLNAMFSKRPESVQDICYAISKLKPDALAYVAFQVVGQMTKPITINIINPEE